MDLKENLIFIVSIKEKRRKRNFLKNTQAVVVVWVLLLLKLMYCESLLIESFQLCSKGGGVNKKKNVYNKICMAKNLTRLLIKTSRARCITSPRLGVVHLAQDKCWRGKGVLILTSKYCTRVHFSFSLYPVFVVFSLWFFPTFKTNINQGTRRAEGKKKRAVVKFCLQGITSGFRFSHVHYTGMCFTVALVCPRGVTIWCFFVF